MSRANVSLACWGEHDWEGWVADEPRASSNARREALRGLQMLYFITAVAVCGRKKLQVSTGFGILPGETAPKKSRVSKNRSHN